MEYYAERRLKRLGLLDDQGKTTWDGELAGGSCRCTAGPAAVAWRCMLKDSGALGRSYMLGLLAC